MDHPPRVLLLPGWQNSASAHWQSCWQALHGFERVEQSDWLTPRRGDWMARLEEELLDDPRPAVLVAHSLGCVLVAAWAAHSRHAQRVRGALLVAPPDLQRNDTPPQLAPWRPVPTQRLPFPSLVVFSSDDPFCSVGRAQQFAADWGAEVLPVGARGHINGESGLGDWTQGAACLARWGVDAQGLQT